MSQNDSQHKRYMQEAINLSRQKMKSNQGGPFGAIVVYKNEVIGRGWNKVTSKNDPTAHAEVEAIRMACKNLKNFQLNEAIIYTSCEPCPMCLSAIYWARIKKIYYANTRTDAAKIQFDDDFIYKEIPKPPSSRKVRMKQISRDEAIKVFKEWSTKSDKVRY